MKLLFMYFSNLLLLPTSSDPNTSFRAVLSNSLSLYLPLNMIHSATKHRAKLWFLHPTLVINKPKNKRFWMEKQQAATPLSHLITS